MLNSNYYDSFNGFPVQQPPLDPLSGSVSAPRWGAADPPGTSTAHPLWKSTTAQLHSATAPFDDFSDKVVRDQALDAVLSLISCSTALAVRILSVPRLMDILLRVIMVSSSTSYSGAVISPNISAAYSQGDAVSAASRVLQVSKECVILWSLFALSLSLLRLFTATSTSTSQIMTILLNHKEAESLFRSKITDLMVLACSDDAVAGKWIRHVRGRQD